MPVLNASPNVHVLFQISITTDNVSPAAPDSVCTCAWSGLALTRLGQGPVASSVSARPSQSCDNRPQHGLPWSLLRPL